jgi:hypothetical protein
VEFRQKTGGIGIAISLGVSSHVEDFSKMLAKLGALLLGCMVALALAVTAAFANQGPF